MKTIKPFLILVNIVLLSLCTEAQNLSTTIKVQAMDMGEAFIKNDFNAFAKYMHPNVIAFAGGKQKMMGKTGGSLIHHCSLIHIL